METLPTWDNPGVFAPVPWITFLIDKAAIECRICFSSKLFLSPPRHRMSDHVPALLPCGHIYGYKCLRTNFDYDVKGRCPECRTTFKYSNCDHICQPRPLNTVNIFTLPPTLNEPGGKLQDQCLVCRLETAKKLFNERIEADREEFDHLRHELKQTGSPETVKKLRVITKRLNIYKGVFFNNDILYGW